MRASGKLSVKVTSLATSRKDSHVPPALSKTLGLLTSLKISASKLQPYRETYFGRPCLAASIEVHEAAWYEVNYRRSAEFGLRQQATASLTERPTQVRRSLAVTKVQLAYREAPKREVLLFSWSLQKSS
jgi:hypothetical protein